ncbi:MAG TPA: DUF1080 domain-containing protein [Pirellulaceae bacterium]|jgi:hypothetical protein|nr:DUF1080 domain-containing protein [Pirellulaceae bacterium]
MTSRRRSRRNFLVTASVAWATAPLVTRFAYAAPKEDWIELYDGKSLKGWHTNPQKIGHGTGGNWQVEDGAITGEQDPPGSGNGGILLTDRKFGDFELLIDLKPDWGICSGLFLRSNDQGQCFQMMVDYHDAGNVGHLYGEGLGGFTMRAFDIDGKYGDDQKLVGFVGNKEITAAAAGLVSSCTAEKWIKAWKINDWNTARVRVEGKYPKISTWINDLAICVFDGANAKVERDGRETYDREKVVAQLGTVGSIAVQVHGGGNWPKGAKCRWKNIKIKPLG